MLKHNHFYLYLLHYNCLHTHNYLMCRWQYNNLFVQNIDYLQYIVHNFHFHNKVYFLNMMLLLDSILSNCLNHSCHRSGSHFQSIVLFLMCSRWNNNLRYSIFQMGKELWYSILCMGRHHNSRRSGSHFQSIVLFLMCSRMYTYR